ncbi:MAG TPA: O-antigen ligase family protein [Bacillota bacterium]|nr:O-antigen ligase family protein [Peptococcaceae bacterium MAG4]NLW37489.1 polymerase [Peptococcaceae bacterium]HPZ43179.1 O-antigen ligase family protein [Bacillota bacterium]HQD75720.1 O-antigen ligase family protein [Bacillota bacterium]HUM58576.1 O-antigen ligase family protein [Bacillota bacterium]
MNGARLWQESLLGRLVEGAGLAWRHSILRQWLNGSAQYSRQEAVRCSLTGRVLTAVAGFPARLLERTGAAIRRGIPGSLFLNLKPHPFLTGSTVLRNVAGIRAETLLWLVISYIVIDYALRSSPATAFLAGNWDELLLVLIFLAWPVQMALRGKLTYRLTPLDFPICLYMAVAIFLFLIRSPHLGIAIEGLRVYVEYMLWFFVGSNLLLNKGQARALVNWLVILGTLVALHGVYQYIIGVPIPENWVDSAETVRTRVFSIVGSPNVLGSFLVMLIPITVSQLLSARGRTRKYLYTLCLVPMVLSLIFTFSRGAWLAMVGALTVYGLMYNWRILLGLAAAAYIAPKLVPTIGARIGYMLSPAYLVSSTRAGRVARWNMALNKVKNNPLTGEGFGRFGGAVADRHIPSSHYVDNFYLKTAAESGLIGIAALVWLLISGVRCALNTYRRLTDPYLKGLAGGMIAGLVGVLLHNVVENIFEVPMMTTYFWLLLGMTAALPHLKGQETPPLD